MVHHSCSRARLVSVGRRPSARAVTDGIHRRRLLIPELQFTLDIHVDGSGDQSNVRVARQCCMGCLSAELVHCRCSWRITTKVLVSCGYSNPYLEALGPGQRQPRCARAFHTMGSMIDGVVCNEVYEQIYIPGQLYCTIGYVYM